MDGAQAFVSYGVEGYDDTGRHSHTCNYLVENDDKLVHFDLRLLKAISLKNASSNGFLEDSASVPVVSPPLLGNRSSWCGWLTENDMTLTSFQIDWIWTKHSVVCRVWLAVLSPSQRPSVQVCLHDTLALPEHAEVV